MSNLENKYDLSFLILDFNREKELRSVLDHLRLNAQFNYQVICHANGGEQSYHYELYKEGKIHKLVLGSKNNGAGFGSVDLWNLCNTDYAIYLESDQILGRQITDKELKSWIKLYNSNPKIKFLNLIGRDTNFEFSQRCFFSNTSFYRQLALELPCGGPGPYVHLGSNEGYTQKYLTDNGFINFSIPQQAFINVGQNAFFESKDGCVYLHKTDLMTCTLVSGIPTIRPEYYQFSDEQWQKIFETKECKDIVPEGWAKGQFKHHWNGFKFEY